MYVGDEIQSKATKPSAMGHGHRSQRPRCNKRKDYKVIKFRLRHGRSSLLSQTPFLPLLQTIRLDPISLCMTDLADPAVKAVFHRITTYFLPALAPCSVEESTPVTQTWLERANASPILYHAMLWGYSFPDYLDRQQRKVIDGHYKTAIQELIKYVDGQTAASDEVLIAVALLSIVERSREEVASFGLFRPMLAKLQTIDIAGSLRFVEPHRSAVKRLVADQGGLGKVVMPGVAEALQYWELFDSVFRLQPPEFDLCKSYQQFLENQVIPLREKRPSSSPGTSGVFPTAFSNLPLTPDFQNLLLDTQVTCKLITDFVSGNVAPSAKEIAQHRNLIQYRLLKLQPQDDALAEICRLAALLFSFCVIFPWPEWSHKRFLAGMLELKLAECDVLQEPAVDGLYREGERSCRASKTELEFLMWAAMIGAMTTGEGMNSSVDVLARLTDVLRLRDWSEAKAILEQYLWLDEACDDGGQTVWWQAMARRTQVADAGFGENILEM